MIWHDSGIILYHKPLAEQVANMKEKVHRKQSIANKASLNLTKALEAKASADRELAEAKKVLGELERQLQEQEQAEQLATPTAASNQQLISQINWMAQFAASVFCFHSVCLLLTSTTPFLCLFILYRHIIGSETMNSL